jgi:hypothetical protein
MDKSIKSSAHVKYSTEEDRPRGTGLSLVDSRGTWVSESPYHATFSSVSTSTEEKPKSQSGSIPALRSFDAKFQQGEIFASQQTRRDSPRPSGGRPEPANRLGLALLDSAILLHMLPMPAQCDYNANDSGLVVKPCKFPEIYVNPTSE